MIGNYLESPKFYFFKGAFIFSINYKIGIVIPKDLSSNYFNIRILDLWKIVTAPYYF
jgi:hypothetical protein